MNDQSKPPNQSQKSAQKYFAKASGQDDSTIKQTLKKERNAMAAKTAKLRELRLAKEAAEKVEADKLALESGKKPATRKRPATPKHKTTIMRY